MTKVRILFEKKWVWSVCIFHFIEDFIHKGAKMFEQFSTFSDQGKYKCEEENNVLSLFFVARRNTNRRDNVMFVGKGNGLFDFITGLNESKMLQEVPTNFVSVIYVNDQLR